MIKLHVDAVLAVRDGFTGAPAAPNAVQCALNGNRFSPIRKDGGYLVFSGIGSGEHEVVLSCPRFEHERLTLSCSGLNCVEQIVTLKPAAGYPFGSRVTRLTLTVKRGKAPAAGARLWLASRNPLSELKIAQELLEKGDMQTKLFVKSQAALVLPGNFLLSDGESTELCRLDAMDGDVGGFFAPVRFEHKRSRSLYPAQLFTADGEGRIRAVFGEPVELEVYDDSSGKTSTLKLTSGENEAEFKL